MRRGSGGFDSKSHAWEPGFAELQPTRTGGIKIDHRTSRPRAVNVFTPPQAQGPAAGFGILDQFDTRWSKLMLEMMR